MAILDDILDGAHKSGLAVGAMGATAVTSVMLEGLLCENLHYNKSAGYESSSALTVYLKTLLQLAGYSSVTFFCGYMIGAIPGAVGVSLYQGGKCMYSLFKPRAIPPVQNDPPQPRIP